MNQVNNLSELKEKINKRINNNIYISYLESVWNKYKFVLLFIITIILIAFIEMKIATCSSDCSYKLNKNNISKISPPCLHLPDGMYLYVYNVSKFNASEVYNKIGNGNIVKNDMGKYNTNNEHFNQVNINDYKKYIVGEHISDKIASPLHTIKEGFKSLFSSSTPINNITNGIVNGYKLKDIVNPTNSFNNFDSSWRILYPSNIKLNCFSSEGVLYFNN